jgi:hypothetical protein
LVQVPSKKSLKTARSELRQIQFVSALCFFVSALRGQVPALWLFVSALGRQVPALGCEVPALGLKVQEHCDEVPAFCLEVQELGRQVQLKTAQIRLDTGAGRK